MDFFLSRPHRWTVLQCYSLQKTVCVMCVCVCNCFEKCQRGLWTPHQKAFFFFKVKCWIGWKMILIFVPLPSFIWNCYILMILRPMCLYSVIYINPSTHQTKLVLNTKFTGCAQIIGSSIIFYFSLPQFQRASALDAEKKLLKTACHPVQR